MRIHRRIFTSTLLFVTAGLVACDAPDDRGLGDLEEPDRGSVGGKGDDVSGAVAPDPGQLRWSDLAPVQGAPQGRPLLVSNNPEHVGGFGILAGVPYPGLDIALPQRAPEAPSAQWQPAVVDARCPDGGMMDFGIYLAHILPASLGSGRRITLALVPETDATVTVYGDMGTTDWSAGGQLLTRRTDWLGADLAKSFFFRGDLPERTLSAKAGQMLVIDEQLATSLVEGRYQVESDACVYPFVIAHAANLGGVLPKHYAEGDVKWPGWYGGAGHGRAAGIYEADGWRGEQTVAITEAPSAVGVGLLTPDDSMAALARHGDSAELLFGNYGVMVDQTLNLRNDAEECVDATVEFVSYIDRNSSPDRTPTVGFFEATADAYTPSMFWNGPVAAETAAGDLLYHPVLHYAPTSTERAQPDRAVQSMRHPVASLELGPGSSTQVRVRVPVPGYIVAPVGLTVHAQPCA